MKKESKKKLGFKQWCLEFLKRNYIYIIMVVLVALRIGLGYAMGAWYGADQTCDDLVMFDGLSLKRLTQPDYMSLVKDLNFSVFLGVSAISKLPYTIVLSLFWVLAALTTWLLVRKVCKNKWVQLVIFSYVLFLPTAFEAWGGLRVYRNSIIVPCIILTFSLALMVLVNLIKKEKMSRTAWIAVATGFSFAFLYYLQEDGIWIMACMLVIFAISFAIICYRLFRKKKKERILAKNAIAWLAICLVPFVVLFSWGTVYKSVNQKFFGVYETNTRTKGELAKYIEKTYIVDSPNRSKTVWSPYDAIEATFKVSPTLQEHSKILEKIKITPWSAGDAEKNPFPREYLGWVIRVAIADAGYWTSEKDVSDMFKQVNIELDEAFSKGDLKKAEGRVQLLKSAGAYTWGEIFDGQFVDHLFRSFRDAIWLEGYTIGFYSQVGDTDYKRDNTILHMSGDINNSKGVKREIGNVVANIIVWIYRVVNIALMALSLWFIIYQAVKLIKNWKIKKKYVKDNRLELVLAVTSFMFLGVTIVYSLGISWFFTEEFTRQIFVFYHIGMSGILVFVYMPALIGTNHFLARRAKK